MIPLIRYTNTLLTIYGPPGLVCITPAAGFVDMTGAFFIGFFGGPLCYAGSQLKSYFGYDDALDAFGVHAIGGIVGGLATGEEK